MWATKFLGQGREDGAMRPLILGLCITIPTSIAYPIMPTAELAVAAMFVAFIGKSVATAGGPAALSLITPGEMRGRAMAIFNMVIMLIGPMIGPPLIGWAVDLTGNPASIGVVLSGFVLLLGAPTLLVVWLGQRHYHDAVAEMAAVTDLSAAPAQS
jgi:MFS family permease